MDLDFDVKSIKIFRLEYDSKTDTSLVKCIPLTGRTHQIRRHLLALGHPVINDYRYNEKDVRRLPIIDTDIIKQALNRMLARKSEVKKCGSIPYNPDLNNLDWIKTMSDTFKVDREFCLQCELGKDFMRKREKDSVELMCLHAFSYEIDGKLFEAPFPKWITDNEYFVQDIIKRRRV